jgi:uncharacterized protein (DUF1778 family)
MTTPIHETQDRRSRSTAQTVGIDWDILYRMERAVGKVRERLLPATSALNQAPTPDLARLDFKTVLAYVFNVYQEERAMPREAVDDNNRVALRVRSADKATIMRAVALAQTDMTTFILRTVMREAESVIKEHERVKLTKRDSRLVMELLEHPPAPNAKLRKAARDLPKR